MKNAKKAKQSKSSRLFNYTLIPFEQVYRFKITLQDTPPVWRLIEVPACYDFWNLHCAIQDAMGWKDCHMHLFRIPTNNPKEPALFGIPDKLQKDGIPGSWKGKVADYLTPENNTADYIYDFGDDWHHSVVLEGIFPRFAGVAYPRCLAGERACPPEDCGGAIGYEMLLEALKDPKHPEHKSMKRWVGKDYDPEWFHPGEVKFSDPQERWDRAFMGDSLGNTSI